MGLFLADLFKRASLHSLHFFVYKIKLELRENQYTVIILTFIFFFIYLTHINHRPINPQPLCQYRTQTLHFSFLNADKHCHWMSSLLCSASDAAESKGYSDEDEEPSDYAGHVLALNGHKKYFCLFRPVFTGDDANDSSSETSFSSDSRRKSRSRSRSSSHSRSRSHSREDGAGPKRGSSRATSIQVHHKLDRLGLWMERLMEGTLPRLQVTAWPSLNETANTASTDS